MKKGIRLGRTLGTKSLRIYCLIFSHQIMLTQLLLRNHLVSWFLLLSCTVACESSLAQSGRPDIDTRYGEQEIFIPKSTGLFGVDLQTTVYRPLGAGPFPLVVVNHGKAFGPASMEQRARYMPIAHMLVRRGFVVMIPMRQGFAKSGGSYNESSNCNIEGDGLMQAESVVAAIDYARRLNFVDGSRIVIVGQSHGGLTTMALGTYEIPGVLGIVNFAGGLKVTNCNWTSNLIQAFKSYGSHAHYPSLWFYGENDSYFPPGLVQRMHEEFQSASPQKASAKLVAYGAYDTDSHKLFGDTAGIPVWWPEFERFLSGLGLDTHIKPDALNIQLKNPTPLPSRFADIADTAALPGNSKALKEQYGKWLKLPKPRAFALSADGAYGWSSNDDWANDLAISNCEKRSAASCQLYAVDDLVVWKQ